MPVDAISAIGMALTAGKRAMEAAKLIDSAELRLELVSLMEALADAKMEAVNANERIKELEEALAQREQMEFREGRYWISNDAVPFCSRCWDVDKKSVRCMESAYLGWVCPQCKN